MRAKYLNPVVDSYRNICESALQLKPVKGKVETTDSFETEKQHVMYMQIEGDLNGFFGISFDEETALEIVKKMTGGMAGENGMDEMAESCLQEFGGMIKGTLINLLSQEEYNCDIPKIELIKKSEIAPFPDTILKISTNTDIGEIELNILLNK